MKRDHILLVAVTQRVELIRDRGEVRDCLDQNIAIWLARAACAAVPIPNAIDGRGGSEVSVSSWLEAIKPDAVLLSGGNDIGQFSSRDTAENDVLSWAEQHYVPVLGICRGMQYMASYAGAELITLEGHVRTYHNLGEGWPGQVNSFHNFGLRECPPGYKVLARADDGTVEAIRHESLPWEGWMWHPERGVFRSSDIERFREIIDFGHGR